MKLISGLILSLTLTACATVSNSFDRDTESWASTIVACKSAADVAGTNSEKAVWAYERQELLNDRNGGWPSDRARLKSALKKNKQKLAEAGHTETVQTLARCNQIIAANFPEGHPAA